MCRCPRFLSNKFVVGLLACAGSLAAGAAAGQQQKTPAAPASKVPQISWIFPAGAKRGATAEFELKGKNLNNVTQLYFSRPLGAVQSLETKGTDRLLATIAIDEITDLGSVELRAVSSDGMSNMKLFRVDEFPEVNETTERNDAPAQAQTLALPAVANGQLANADIDCYRIHAQKGERVVIEVEARRLGSPVEARLRLLDQNGRLLADASTTRGIRPDERLDYEFSETGAYIVAIEDAQYVGGDGAVYRLRAGSWPYASAQFPLGGRSGQKIALTLQGGNLPEPVTQTITLPSHPENSLMRVQLRHGGGTLVAPMLLLVADDYEVAEQEPNGDFKSPQSITAPCTVNGRIDEVGDRDRFVITAKKGEKFIVEVFADRLGSWLDSMLTISDQNGRTVVENDDARQGNSQQNAQAKTGTTAIADSRAEFTAPADGKFIVSVDDRYYSGGPEFAYRLVVAPGVPDFQLALGPAPNTRNQPQPKNQSTTPVDVVNLEPGKSAVVSVNVSRRGYDGEIELGVQGLPDGVTSDPAKIPAKQQAAQITLKANSEAPASIGRARVLGKATINEQEVIRFAQSEIVVAQLDPIHTARVELSDIALAILRRDNPLALRVNSAAEIALGTETEIHVLVERKAGFKGPVELKVDQLPKGISAEGVTLHPDEKEAALKLCSSAIIPTGTQKIQVHSQGRFGAVAVQASAEIAINIVMPFELTLDSADTQLELVAGETSSLKIGIKRFGGFNGPIELEVTGLPPGVAVTAEKVDPDQDEVELSFAAPDGIKSDQTVKQLRIQATSEIGEEKVRVESTPIAVTVKEAP